jgi:hypothetical protein
MLTEFGMPFVKYILYRPFGIISLLHSRKPVQENPQDFRTSAPDIQCIFRFLN